MSGLAETADQSQVTGVEIGQDDLGMITTEKQMVVVGGTDSESRNLLLSARTKELSDFLTRTTRIATGLLQASDTAYANLLASPFDPFILFLSNTYIAAKVKEFSWFRADMEVIFTLTVPSNAYGLYNLQALCQGGENSDATTVLLNDINQDNVWSSMQDVHALIDITKSTTVVLKLPWVYPRDALQSTGDSGPWRLCLFPLQPIMNAMNTDVIAGTYNIYTRFLPGFELGLPTYQSGKSAVSKSKAAEANPLKLSRVAAGASGVASMIGTALPQFRPMAQAAAAGLASVASIADYFGFTKESAPVAPVPMVMRSINNLATCDGEDTGDIVALFNSNATTTDPTIGGGSAEDETSIASLYARETIIDTFTWSLADSAGTVMRNIPCTPFFNWVDTSLNQYPTVAGYVGLPFARWRGGMRYRVYIPSSMYHRGMLQIFWSPTIFNFSGAPDLTNVLFNVIIDVTADNFIEIEVPYAMPQMCLSNTGLLNPGAQVTAVPGVNCNGSLYFVVANQLQTVGATGNLQIFVTASACPDMRFGVPLAAGPFLSDGTVSTSKTMGYIWQMQGDDSDGDGPAIKTVNLLGGPCVVKSYPVEDVLWGEVFGSVRALAQRVCYINQYVSGTSGGFFAFPHLWPPVAHSAYTAATTTVAPTNTYITGYFPPWTWHSHYSQLFVGVRGSTRIKAVASVPNHAIVAIPFSASETSYFQANPAICQPSTNPVAFGGIQAAVQMANAGGGVEYLFPYYDIQKFRLSRYVYGTLGVDKNRVDGINVVTAPGSAITGDIVTFFEGAGPDVTYVKFRRVPILSIY